MTAQSLTHIAAEAHRHDLRSAAEQRRVHAAPRAGGRSRRRLELRGRRPLRPRLV